MGKRNVNRFKAFFLFAVGRTVLFLLTCWPWPVCRRLANLFGRLGYHMDRDKRKENSLENLRRVYPELSEAELRRLLKRVYMHMTCSFVDAFKFVKAVQKGRGRDLIETRGFEAVDEACRDSGVIFVTGHVGNWELLGAAGPLTDYPTWTVYRGFRNPFADRFVRRQRELTGQKTIEKQGALRRVIRLLRSGENVAFLIDQDARHRGIFVDFFDRPASTPPGPARISYSTGAPVAFVYAQRQDDGRFRIEVTDVIRPDREASRTAEVKRITQRLTSDLEAVVRKHPEQWLWLHRRWKTWPGKYEEVAKSNQ